VASRWLPVPEAAVALGVYTITLKRHIKNGKVTARREEMDRGWRWLIEVSDDQVVEPEELDRTEDLISALRSQVEWYQQQLATRDREVSELHILLQRSQQIHQLPPPVQEYQPEAASILRDTSTDASPKQERSRGFWQRLFGTA
jgi:hypothetical protein